MCLCFVCECGGGGMGCMTVYRTISYSVSLNDFNASFAQNQRLSLTAFIVYLYIFKSLSCK